MHRIVNFGNCRILFLIGNEKCRVVQWSILVAQWSFLIAQWGIPVRKSDMDHNSQNLEVYSK